jgi:putative restriction endonuclease
MYSSALAKFSEYLSEGYGNDVEAEIDSILDDDGLSKTEKCNLVKSRIGQGIFRQNVLSYWKACAVTSFKNTSLLVASHIKPWRLSNNSERLDPFNGLLLIPNLDRTFDAGLITFQIDGCIKLSPLLTEPQKLGIKPDMLISLSSQHEVFMQFHRIMVYRAA